MYGYLIILQRGITLSMEFKIISNIEDNLDLLEEAWSHFDIKDIPNGFVFSQLVDWWKQYGKIDNPRLGFKKTPFIVLIYRNSELAGIFPLVKLYRYRIKYLKIEILEFLSQSFTSKELDIIGNNFTENEIKQIFYFIRKKIRFDVLNLAYLEADSKLISGFKESSFYHSEIPVIHIDSDYEEIRIKSYSRNLRSNINKFHRKIKELTNQQVIAKVLFGKEDVQIYYDKIKAVSDSKLLSLGMHSIYATEIGEKYFKSIINDGVPYCSVYELDDILLAYILGNIQDDGTVYYFDGAYNRNFENKKNIGFGILALDQAVKYFAGKYKTYNLGFGQAPYKMQFTKKTIPFYQIYFRGTTLFGELYYRRIIRKFIKRNSCII